MILPYPIHLTLTARVRLAALATGYVLLAAAGLNRYLYLSIDLLFGLMAVFINWDGRRAGRSGSIYMIFALGLALLYGHLASKSLLLASIVFSLLSLSELTIGKPGWIAALALLVTTPLFEYFSNVFSFPVRIALTKASGQILTVMDTGFRAEGNTLLNGHSEFSVDPACMGLHMLSISLLTGLILTGIQCKKLNLKVSFPVVSGFLLLLVLLNILSNLFRIVLLVQFRVLPQSPMHAFTGIACFIIYVLLPAQWLAAFGVKRFGKPVPERTATPANRIPGSFLMRHLLLLAVTAIVVFRTEDKSANANLQLGTVNVPGYNTELLRDRIVKLTASESLIYIKPIAGFYSADHQPGTCWSGSGYSFKKVQEKILAGRPRYTARLEKDNAVLYSAWWYDCGIFSSTSQLKWRWDAFRHARKYALVNVTATTEAGLETEIRKFTKLNPCHTMLLN